MTFHRRYRSLSFNSMEGHLEGGEYIYIYSWRTHFSVGKDQWIKFWHDYLLGGGPLKDHFHGLFNVLVHREAWVSHYWDGCCCSPSLHQ